MIYRTREQAEIELKMNERELPQFNWMIEERDAIQSGHGRIMFAVVNAGKRDKRADVCECAMTFHEKLSNIIETLGEMGANDMGALSFAQAALFHGATALLQSLEEDLDAAEYGDEHRFSYDTVYGERLP